MTWVALIPGIAGLVAALTAFIRGETNRKNLSVHLNGGVDIPPQR